MDTEVFWYVVMQFKDDSIDCVYVNSMYSLEQALKHAFDGFKETNSEDKVLFAKKLVISLKEIKKTNTAAARAAEGSM